MKVHWSLETRPRAFHSLFSALAVLWGVMLLRFQPPRAPRPSRPALGRRECSVTAAAERKAPSSRGQPAGSKPPNAAAQVLGAAETLSLAAALGSHLYAALAAQRQQQAGARQAARGEYSISIRAPQQPQPAAPPATLWLSLPLLLALLFRRLLAALTRQPSAARLSDLAAARMARVEGIASEQQAALQQLSRQMEKAQTRTRLTGRDLRTPLRQLETSAAQHGDALVSLAARLEAMEGDLKDTEALVAALQGVSAKQFDLLMRVVKQQQQQPGQQPVQQQKQGRAAEAVGLPRQQQQATQTPGPGEPATTDEWGRKLAPLASSGSGAAAGTPGATASSEAPDAAAPPAEVQGAEAPAGQETPAENAGDEEPRVTADAEGAVTFTFQ